MPARPAGSERIARPYRSWTNGRVERIISTLLETWAYAYPCAQERERAAALVARLASIKPLL